MSRILGSKIGVAENRSARGRGVDGGEMTGSRGAAFCSLSRRRVAKMNIGFNKSAVKQES
jgi:hypothetical protein